MGTPRFVFAALCLACCTAWAQPAALSHIEGSVALSTQGDDEWTDVRHRRALRERDRLWTDPASRAELQAGAHVLRLDARSHLTLDKLQPAQVSLRRGSLQARLAPTSGGAQVEIDTPNLALRASGPAHLRVDVDVQRGVTQVSIVQGSATLFGDKGQKRGLQAGQSASFAGRALLPAAAVRPVATDDFERWIQARERSGTPQTSAMGAAVAPRALDPRAPREPEARQAQRSASRNQPAATTAQQQRHQAWVRQQRDLSERWRREHEEWLRWQEGGPPPPSMRQPQQGIPARRVG